MQSLVKTGLNLNKCLVQDLFSVTRFEIKSETLPAGLKVRYLMKRRFILFVIGYFYPLTAGGLISVRVVYTSAKMKVTTRSPNLFGVSPEDQKDRLDKSYPFILNSH